MIKKIQREAITGLCILGAFAVAQGASAQRPWVPTDSTPTSTAPLQAPAPEQSNYAVESSTDTGVQSSKLDHYLTPPKRALGVQIGAGYGQGIGNISSNNNVPSVHDISGPGGTIQATIGYRATPHFMFGVYGTGSQFAEGNTLISGTNVRSATAGFQADFHARPSYTVDPWLSLASGVRGMWLSPDIGQNTSLLGLQLVRAQVGVDFRMSRGVAIAPVIGGDASLFLTRDGPGFSGFTNINDPRVNVFLFGGLQARFDVGSTSVDANNADVDRLERVLSKAQLERIRGRRNRRPRIQFVLCGPRLWRHVPV